jgi:hypothetical protein
MYRLLLTLALALPLQGCFFFFIPGSVVGKASDAITGAEGQHCVSTLAQVGDKINIGPGRQIGVIKSLSGPSSRCVEADRPIRALIVVEA